MQTLATDMFQVKNNIATKICRKLWIWSHLLKKPLVENFIFVQWLWKS